MDAPAAARPVGELAPPTPETTPITAAIGATTSETWRSDMPSERWRKLGPNCDTA